MKTLRQAFQADSATGIKVPGAVVVVSVTTARGIKGGWEMSVAGSCGVMHRTKCAEPVHS